ncbi:hypothetical protein NMY22_g6928 [Coprinellus aureogranulatus]|nr:hypothetical protein NMY22_g6928 [Coprinellus aureogranulatus]
MWPNYNVDEAVLSLNSYIAKVSQENSGEVALSDLDLSSFVVRQEENTRALKIVSQMDPSQELTTKIVGILCSKTLPPFRNSLQSHDHRHLKKLRQHVKVTGGGSQLFDDYELKVNSVVDLFRSVVGEGALEVPDTGLFDGQYALDFHTRYFEERRYAPGVAHVPFDATVDPRGVLETARGVEFVHGEGNIVEYCVKTYDEQGLPRYDVLAPEHFSIGDIVEVCGTYTLYPYRNEEQENVRYRLVMGMRVLSLLKNDFSKAMRQASVTKTKGSKDPRRIPKASPRRKFLTRQSSNRGDSGSEDRGRGEMDVA